MEVTKAVYAGGAAISAGKAAVYEWGSAIYVEGKPPMSLCEPRGGRGGMASAIYGQSHLWEEPLCAETFMTGEAPRTTQKTEE